MHYINGTEAREGDLIVTRDYAGKVQVGTIHSLKANCETCNGTIAIVVPGSVFQYAVTIKDCWKASDLLEKAETEIENGMKPVATGN